VVRPFISCWSSAEVLLVPSKSLFDPVRPALMGFAPYLSSPATSIYDSAISRVLGISDSKEAL